jgi:hypothetical protein
LPLLEAEIAQAGQVGGVLDGLPPSVVAARIYWAALREFQGTGDLGMGEIDAKVALDRAFAYYFTGTSGSLSGSRCGSVASQPLPAQVVTPGEAPAPRPAPWAHLAKAPAPVVAETTPAKCPSVDLFESEGSWGWDEGFITTRLEDVGIPGNRKFGSSSFDGLPYPLWKTQVHQKVRSNNLKGHQAFLYLLKCVTEPLQNFLESSVTSAHGPREMWNRACEILDRQNSGKTGLSINFSIDSLKQRNNETVRDWSFRLWAQIRQYEVATGEQVSEKRAIRILLNGAREGLQFWARLGRARDLDSMTFEELTADLELRSNEVEVRRGDWFVPKDQARAAQPPLVGNRESRERYDRSPRDREGDGVAVLRSRVPWDTCHGCGKRGHQKAECPTRDSNVCTFCRGRGHVEATCQRKLGGNSSPMGNQPRTGVIPVTSRTGNVLTQTHRDRRVAVGVTMERELPPRPGV